MPTSTSAIRTFIWRRRPTEKPRKTIFDSVPVRGNTLLKALLAESFVVIPSVLFRREILASAGLFDTALISSEDFDFLLRIAAKYERHLRRRVLGVRPRTPPPLSARRIIACTIRN